MGGLGIGSVANRNKALLGKSRSFPIGREALWVKVISSKYGIGELMELLPAGFNFYQAPWKLELDLLPLLLSNICYNVGKSDCTPFWKYSDTK